MLRDRLVPQNSSTGPIPSGFGITLLLDRVLPQSTASVVYQCTVPIRGSYRFADPELSTQFPMSLMRGYRTLPNAQIAIVHPTPGLLAKNWRDLLKLPVHGRLRRQSTSAGGDGEFFGLRDYRLGDPARHIHWRTSAKRGELVIRQFEREENHAIGVVLDTTLSGISQAAELAGFEIAVELVATLIERVVSAEGSIATLAISGEAGNGVTRLQTTNQLNVALDRLALVHTQKNDTLLKSLQQALRHTGGRDPIVVVSTRSRESFFSRGYALGSAMAENQAFDASLNLSALENRLVWIDVSQDHLESIFVRG